MSFEQLAKEQSNFEILSQEVQSGIEGRNSGIPMGFQRLNRYVGIRKRIFTTVFGGTGTGKSALVHNAWILQPFDYLQKHKDSSIKMKVILFSMERSKVYILAKWLSRKIFLDVGILIPLQKLLGWWETKLTKDEHDLFLAYQPYIDELSEFCDIIEGPINPTGMWKYVKTYAEQNGKFEQISEYKKVYISNHPNEIVVPIIDHYALASVESGMNKKETVDKVSSYCQLMRDLLGYSPVGVSQINRDLSGMMLKKVDSFEPTLDHIKESGRMAEDKV